MDQWGGDSARQGIEKLEGRHELFPIDQKRNAIDIEMQHCMLYRYWTQPKSKSQYFGLMGYLANQARLHIRLQDEELPQSYRISSLFFPFTPHPVNNLEDGRDSFHRLLIDA
jgi:hypothetical protein